MPSGSGSRGGAPPEDEGASEEEGPGRPHEVDANRGVLPAAPPVVLVQVSSSSSGEEEDDESGDRASKGGGDEAEGPSLPSCPVCMSPWTADGKHRVSCIPCGHVYGRSCLERWLTQCGKKHTTCPQCGKRFKEKHIINLYAPEIVVPNNYLEKQVLSLREKNESLEKQREKLIQEIKEYKRQNLLQQNLADESSSKRLKMEEQSSDGAVHAELVASLRANVDGDSPCKLIPQNEYFLDGARVIGIDASSQIILASGKTPGVSAEHVLQSLFSGAMQKIRLPSDTKGVKDICILPGGNAVFTSLGRKLSLLSMTTNNIVLQYNLPAPGWSCSGFQTSSNCIYAGLQNGMLLVFDTRQTAAPLYSMMGLSTNPVHTIHCVVDDTGSRKVISASSIGPCIWDVDGSKDRPEFLTGTENQGVCISLACAPPSSDLLVASFRPKVELSADGTTSQSLTPSGSGKLGCHVLIRRTSNASFARYQVCSGNVSELLMPKSSIIPCSGDNQQHLFAYGDESLRRVRTWRLPLFQNFTDLSPHRKPILDLRFAESSAGHRYLGCLSEEKLQVFKIG